VDEAVLRRAIGTVLDRTEALRVRVRVEDGRPWQALPPDPEWRLEVLDVSGEPDPVGAAEAWMRADISTPVDLTGGGPLLRQALYRLAADRYAYYLRYHHIVLDGFGQTMYWLRVARTYTSLAGGPAVSTAARAAGRLSDLLDEETAYRTCADFVRDREYWLERFADPTEPRFPRDETHRRLPLLGSWLRVRFAVDPFFRFSSSSA